MPGQTTIYDYTDSQVPQNNTRTVAKPIIRHDEEDCQPALIHLQNFLSKLDPSLLK